MKTKLITCKVTEDVRNYEFRNDAWESLQIRTRDTLDLRLTRRWLKGHPSFWVMCLGDPKYNNPTHQWKAMSCGEYSVSVFRMSPKQVHLRRELRAMAKKILTDNASARIKEAQKEKGSKTDQEAQAKAFKQIFSNGALSFEDDIDYALEGLDHQKEPRMDRVGHAIPIQVHNRVQANATERHQVVYGVDVGLQRSILNGASATEDCKSCLYSSGI